MDAPPGGRVRREKATCAGGYAWSPPPLPQFDAHQGPTDAPAHLHILDGRILSEARKDGVLVRHGRPSEVEVNPAARVREPGRGEGGGEHVRLERAGKEALRADQDPPGRQVCVEVCEGVADGARLDDKVVAPANNDRERRNEQQCRPEGERST